jgi:hypothetical protein
VAQLRLMRRHPALAAQQLTTYSSLEDELTAEITARAEWAAAGPMRARLMAASFLCAMRVALLEWLDRPAGTPLGPVLREALRETGAAFH